MRAALPSLALLLAACGSSPSDPPDAGQARPDSGAMADAGTPPDAGSLDAAVADLGVDAGALPDAGEAPDVPSFPDAGGPLDPARQNLGNWTWIPVQGSVCRDGSPTGIGVKLKPGATRLFVYLDAGGACFNAQTCANNADHYGSAELQAWARGAGNAGLFSNQAANLLASWNQVLVPYCTGDVHGGSATNKDVAGGPAGQQFVGHQNVERGVALLKEAFGGGLAQVVLAGSSAGGFGSFVNYGTLAEAFAPLPVTLIADSGPMMRDDQALAPCLEQTWVDLWGINAGLPAGCAACQSTTGQGLEELPRYYADTYPSARFGLVSSQEDAIIRQFFGFGSNNCGAFQIVPGPPYTGALTDLRDNVLVPTGKWSTYFAPGDGHVFLREPEIRNTSVGGTPLTTFLRDVIEGRVSQVAP